MELFRDIFVSTRSLFFLVHILIWKPKEDALVYLVVWFKSLNFSMLFLEQKGVRLQVGDLHCLKNI
jgi:hypothetical protein